MTDDLTDIATGRTYRIALWIQASRRIIIPAILAIALAIGASAGMDRSDQQQAAARTRWGVPITGTVVKSDYNGEFFDDMWLKNDRINFTDKKGGMWHVFRVMDDRKVSAKVQLWVASDGNVFVRRSYRASDDPNFRSDPWPRTQGTVAWAMFAALLFGLCAVGFLLSTAGAIVDRSRKTKPGTTQPQTAAA